MRHSGQHGVSMVELMVSIVVLTIVLATGVPSFAAWLQNRQIRTAAESIQNGLQLARAEAVRRNHAVQFVLGTGSGWQVGCTPADESTGEANCPASIQQRDAGEGSRNATVSLQDTTGSLTFNAFGRAATPSANPAIFNIANPSGGDCAPGGPMHCLRVLVSAGGQIRMCDPALPSNDARAC